MKKNLLRVTLIIMVFVVGGSTIPTQYKENKNEGKVEYGNPSQGGSEGFHKFRINNED